MWGKERESGEQQFCLNRVQTIPKKNIPRESQEGGNKNIKGNMCVGNVKEGRGAGVQEWKGNEINGEKNVV